MEIEMTRKYQEITFTPAVLAAQERYYGRRRPPTGTVANDVLGPDEAAFIAARDSFYLATVTESGWPYLQHRGGPPGFLRLLGPATLAFADYRGNHQLLTAGSLARNDRLALFLMDYPNRTRLKLFGHARVEDARAHPELVERLGEAAMQPLVERLILIDVVAFDWNCPQHITPRFSAAEVEAVVRPLREQIAALQSQAAHQRSRAGGAP
jgi:predicted pyridoxine 5'-phosphate oxidase superfamily flavin-nucleotide-binding protein